MNKKEPKLEDFFSIENILNDLIQIRLRLASQRKDRIFYSTFVQRSYPEIEADQVDSLLPPRRQWSKFRPTRKKRVGKSSQQIQFSAIKRTVIQTLNKQEHTTSPWYKRLYKFHLDLLDMLESNKEVDFGDPILIKKTGNQNSRLTNECRVIHVPSSLKDRIFLKVVARYLREVFDPYLSDNVHAFRLNQASQATAITKLQRFKKNHSDSQLFAAETDIQKFFDTIPHKEVMQSLFKFISTAEDHDSPPDQRAINVVFSQLENYSYQEAMRKVEESNRDSEQDFIISKPNEDHIKRLENTYGEDGFGLPQGGSLSNLLANLVLSSADEAVESIMGNTSGLYARYCDDVIFVHSDKKTCQEMMESYTNQIHKIGLETHPAELGTLSAHKYFDSKTLEAYPWGSNTSDTNQRPWISFLGYHIHESGALRLRKSTVRNEHDKQIQLIDHIISQIDFDLKNGKHPDSTILALFKVRMRMISMSVGQWPFRFKGTKIEQPCWTNAFPLLNQNPFVGQQMKQLDRNRERQLARLKRALRQRNLSVEWPKDYEIWKPTQFTYFGFPFSYLASVESSSRNSIPDDNRRFFHKGSVAY